jgi:hypothetical protein
VAGLGVPAFLLDVTWGLGGNTNAVLMHLINFAWGDHGDGPTENRHDAHRYVQGFAVRSGFAFTQGAVMSNTHLGPDVGPVQARDDPHLAKPGAGAVLLVLLCRLDGADHHPGPDRRADRFQPPDRRRHHLVDLFRQSLGGDGLRHRQPVGSHRARVFMATAAR